MSPLLARPRQLLPGALLVVALVVAACGTGPTEPGDAVGDAVEQTLRGSFAFTLRVEADDAGRALMTEEDPQFAAVLRSLEVRGTVDRPGVQFTVEALGFEVFELRRVSTDRTYIRLDPDAVALLSEGDFDAAMVRRDLEDAPEPLREAGEALLTGGWVALHGDPRDLGDGEPLPLLPWSGIGGDEEIKEAFRRHVAADVGEFVDRFTLVTEAAGDDDTVYEVTLRLRALATAVVEMLSESGGPLSWMAEEEVADEFDDIPETIRGLTVDVADRRVQRMALDVLEVGRSAGEDVPEGAISIVVGLTDHGSAAAIVSPDEATVLDLAELFELFMGTARYGHMEFDDDLVIEEPLVDEEAMPAEPFDPSEVDVERGVMLLASAQETRAAEEGAYTEDLTELFEYGFFPIPEVAYGVCVYDGGDAYVVGVATGEASAYLDPTEHREVASDPGGLGCVPELAVLEELEGQ